MRTNEITKQALWISLFFTLTLVSASLRATETNDNQTTYKVSDSVAKGLRIGLSKHFLDAKLTGKKNGEKETLNGEIEQDFGLSIGYAQIGLLKPGFLGQLIYDQNNSDASTLRAAANITYGFNPHVYLFGGPNLSKSVRGGPDKSNVGLGFQTGVGFQVSQNLGLDISYLQQNNSGKDSGFDIDLQGRGLEIGIHATF